jgi:DNA-binding MarR family transcriptional regulator
MDAAGSSASPEVYPLRRELLEQLFGVMQRIRQHSSGRAAQLDLSVVQARALVALREPLAMRTLADRLGLDPGNLTGVVDRLEERGLLTREAQPTDRRVRLLVLTADGARLRDDILERVYLLNPIFSGLDEREQRTLSALLAKALNQFPSPETADPRAPAAR